MTTTRDFLLDENGDLAVVNGDFAVVGGKEAVPQGIQTRVQMFLGECILDDSIGVPWLQEILVKNPDSIVVRERLREAIAKTPDVVAVEGAELQIKAERKGSIKYRVHTVYSREPLAGQVEVP